MGGGWDVEHVNAEDAEFGAEDRRDGRLFNHSEHREARETIFSDFSAPATLKSPPFDPIWSTLECWRFGRAAGLHQNECVEAFLDSRELKRLGHGIDRDVWYTRCAGAGLVACQTLADMWREDVAQDARTVLASQGDDRRTMRNRHVGVGRHDGAALAQRLLDQSAGAGWGDGGCAGDRG